MLYNFDDAVSAEYTTVPGGSRIVAQTLRDNMIATGFFTLVSESWGASSGYALLKFAGSNRLVRIYADNHEDRSGLSFSLMQMNGTNIRRTTTLVDTRWVSLPCAFIFRLAVSANKCFIFASWPTVSADAYVFTRDIAGNSFDGFCEQGSGNWYMYSNFGETAYTLNNTVRYGTLLHDGRQALIPACLTDPGSGKITLPLANLFYTVEAATGIYQFAGNEYGYYCNYVMGLA